MSNRAPMPFEQVAVVLELVTQNPRVTINGEDLHALCLAAMAGFDARHKLRALRAAASVFVDKRANAPDGTVYGAGLTNGDFFALREALNGPTPTLYARCLDTCARVMAMRRVGVDHGASYCTCGFLKPRALSDHAESATRHALITGHPVHITKTDASCTKCGPLCLPATAQEGR